MKIVINKCFGGFSLSKKAYEELGLPWDGYGYGYIDGRDGFDRSDPNLIRVVEKLGEKADGKFAELEIVEIPDGTDWVIEEYDGREWIAEAHRTWA